MSELTYDDAMGEALTRLRGVGFEHGPSLVNHAPMAAEALARLGYTDIVPAWVEQNIKLRRHHPVPQARWSLSAQAKEDWAAALGDFSRVADWVAMFDRELADRPWQDVLVQWWPRLLPGASGVLTHGVIRTAHAVRAIALAGEDAPLQRGELAQGLGYWAARYSGMRTLPEQDEDRSAQAFTALDDLVKDGSEYYATTRPSFAVPLIHAITGPAAIRLVCEHLPAEQLWPSYLAARQCVDAMHSYFGGGSASTSSSPQEPLAKDELVATAVELGDEHAIKLAEVAVRFADDRVGLASQVATRQIARHPV